MKTLYFYLLSAKKDEVLKTSFDCEEESVNGCYDYYVKGEFSNYLKKSVLPVELIDKKSKYVDSLWSLKDNQEQELIDFKLKQAQTEFDELQSKIELVAQDIYKLRKLKEGSNEM